MDIAAITMKERVRSAPWNVGRRPFAVAVWVITWMATQVGVAAGWESTAGGRRLKLDIPITDRAGFADVAAEHSGVRFTNEVPASIYLVNQVYLNGSGVALGDVDGDGLCDIYFCNLGRANALYRNLGDWRFEEIARASNVAGPGWWSTGALLADVDGDRDLDLLVNTVGQGTQLFFNDGRGKFTPATGPLLNPDRAGMSMAMADADGDGDLDLYVANYRVDTIRDQPETRLEGERVNGRLVVRTVNGRPATDPEFLGRFELGEDGRIIEHGEPDVLFLNDGRGGFTAVSFTGGRFLDEAGRALTTPPYDWGLSVAFRDLNGDGLPDLYVCNDFESPDRLWWNRGQGRFQAAPWEALRHTSIFSMGVDVGDLDRDGDDDLIISDMLMQGHASRQLRIGDVPAVMHLVGSTLDRPQYSFNTLQLNRGDGTYAEIAFLAGAEASGWTWCPALLDVDLDGFEDVLFPTGHQFDMMNADVIERAEVLKAQRRMSRVEQQQLRTLFARFNTPNVGFRNTGRLRFEDRSQAWGFTEAAISQGLAMADLDGDGDLDLAINNLNSRASLYRNLSSAPRVMVRLRGLPPNTQGIGARLRLLGGAVPEQSQQIVTGSHYVSSDDPVRVFAAGTHNQPMRLEVRWPGGRVSTLDAIQANWVYEVNETLAATNTSPTGPSTPQPWFQAVTNFGPIHTETFFDDAERQPLLPARLSQLGPGVAWLDFNGDGWEDLCIGSGQGGLPAILRNNQRGGFELIPEAQRGRPVAREQLGVVGANGSFLLGAANYQDGTTNGGWIRIYNPERGAAGDSLLGPTSSTGPLAMADVDADGDLDLFVGGRVKAGTYPALADSVLFRNEGGRFTPLRRWEQLGLVSGAVFTDLNLDARPDLVLACDWGPIRVLLNQGGTDWKDVTDDLGLAPWTGWWRGVASGDFDGDGRLDLVASNWGLNSRYRATPQRPLKCYYGDLDGDLVVDLIEAQLDPETGTEVPLRGFRAIGSALPWLRDHAGSFENYGKSSLASLFGDRLKNTPMLAVTTLASAVFLNRGSHFEYRPLPDEAQHTAALGIAVGDFNGDGHEDLFLSQNFFGVPPDGVRQDAGRGLWLQGDGRGAFQAISGQESGVVLYGEQRGCALGDFDHDGRVDFVVAQNGEAARLFRNVRGKPGLRVRLEGSAGNREAFGASLRLRSGSHLSPAREVQAGSGYLSQNSPVHILHPPPGPVVLEVRWPNGRTTTHPVPAEARDVTADIQGMLRVNR